MQKSLGFLFSIFVMMYIVFYVALVFAAFMKYSVKKKLCTWTNTKILVVSYVLFYPLSDAVSSLNA